MNLDQWIRLGFSRGIPAKALYPHYQLDDSFIIEIEDMPVHYRATGEGQPLLLLHGVASSLHTWAGWQDALSKQFRVIALDLPSFGLTGPNLQNDYSVEMYMRILDKLLDHLSVNTLSVAGNSFGGFLAWQYAWRNPKRVQKLLLLDAAGFGTNKANLQDLGFKLIIHPITKKLTHVLTPRSLVKRSVYNAYGDHQKVNQALIDRYFYLLLRKGNRKGFSEVMGKTILNGADYRPILEEIQTPTCIIWGEKDRLIPLRDAHLFEKHLPNTEKIIYEGVGHVPMEEIPEKSAADAQKFLLA